MVWLPLQLHDSEVLIQLHYTARLDTADGWHECGVQLGCNAGGGQELNDWTRWPAIGVVVGTRVGYALYTACGVIVNVRAKEMV